MFTSPRARTPATTQQAQTHLKLVVVLERAKLGELLLLGGRGRSGCLLGLLLVLLGHVAR
jgi:hypothetical protein